MSESFIQEPNPSNQQPDTATILTTKGPLATKTVTWSPELKSPQIIGYGKAARFRAESRLLGDVNDVFDLLTALQGMRFSFLIRGEPIAGTNTADMPRRLHARADQPATIQAAPRRLIPLDIDSLTCPAHIDPLHDIDAVVGHVIGHLPEEFQGVSCVWTLTSGHGIKPGIRCRLWFMGDRPLEDWELKTWLADSPVDHSIFAPAQPIYTAAPIFIGIPDPVPTRVGLFRRERGVVVAPVIVKPVKTSRVAAPARPDKGIAPKAVKPLGNPPRGSGFEYHLGRIGDHEGAGGFHGPVKAAVAAWFAREGADADVAVLRDPLEAAIRSAPRNNALHPDSYVDLRVRDLDTLIPAIQAMEKGKKRPATAPTSPLTPTFSDADHVCLAEGERLAEEWRARFMARVRGWENWEGEQIKPDRRPAGTDILDFNPPAPEPTAPCELLKATLALGKTKIITELCADAPTNAVVNVYARDHASVAELADRITAKVNGKHRVIPCYGRSQNLPDGTPVCSQSALAEQIQGCGKSVESCLCKLEVAPGQFEYCVDHPEASSSGCHYQKISLDNEPGIRVAPHAYLGIPRKTSPLPDAKLSLIDEDPTSALIRDSDGYGVPLRLIIDTNWVVKKRKKEDRADDQQSIRDYSTALHNVLAEPNPTPAKLRSAGLDAGNTKWMAGVWFDQVEELAVTPAMPKAKKDAAIAAYRSQIALKMGRLWTLVHDVIDLNLNELRCIRIKEVLKEHPETMVMMVWSIDPKIDGPVAIFDGTADEEITRRFFPTVQVTTINVRAELDSYHAIQVVDRAVSKTMLGYGLDKDLEFPRIDEVQRSKNRRADLARLAEVEAARCGGQIPVITYKPVAEALRFEHPRLAELGVEVGYLRPDGKRAGHFGAVRGTDRWRDAPTGIIAGRNLPPRDALERQARAIFYKEDRPMTYQGPGLYDSCEHVIRTADGMGRSVMNETHPDPLIRRVLVQSVRAEAEQAVHRLRLIRRTSATPARIVIAANTCLNLTIHETVSWADIVPKHADVMAARGVVPSDWTSRALVVADMLVGCVDPANALQQAVGSRRECLSNPNGIDSIGKPQTFAGHSYRVAGNRKGAAVWVSTRHGDPRAAVERWLGPLDRFTPVGTVAPQTAQTAIVGTVAVTGAASVVAIHAEITVPSAPPSNGNVDDIPLDLPPTLAPTLPARRPSENPFAWRCRAMQFLETHGVDWVIAAKMVAKVPDLEDSSEAQTLNSA